MRDWSPVLGLPLWVWLFVLPSGLALACLIAGPRMEPALRPAWKLLDKIYRAAGAALTMAGWMAAGKATAG